MFVRFSAPGGSKTYINPSGVARFFDTADSVDGRRVAVIVFHDGLQFEVASTAEEIYEVFSRCRSLLKTDCNS